MASAGNSLCRSETVTTYKCVISNNLYVINIILASDPKDPTYTTYHIHGYRDGVSWICNAAYYKIAEGTSSRKETEDLIFKYLLHTNFKKSLDHEDITDEILAFTKSTEVPDNSIQTEMKHFVAEYCDAKAQITALTAQNHELTAKNLELKSKAQMIAATLSGHLAEYKDATWAKQEQLVEESRFIMRIVLDRLNTLASAE